MQISTIFQSVLSGSVLLAVIILIRRLFSGNVTRRIFVAMWCIAFLRLLIPFSVKVPVVNFNFGEKFTKSDNTISEIVGNSDYIVDYDNDFSQWYDISFSQPISDDFPPEPFNENPTVAALPIESMIYIVWGTGTAAMLVYFTAAYFHSKRKFRFCQVVNDEKLSEFIRLQGIRRKVKVLVSDNAISPMTYGIIKPVVVLSDNSSQHIEFVLKHELSHIKSLDVLKKAFAILVLSVFWFNPIVWVAVRMFNEDIEFACDERVLKSSAKDIRKDYALALIEMNRFDKNPKLLLSSGFSKNNIEERIVLIMKSNKTKFAKTIAVACAAVAAVGISGFTITSASENDDAVQSDNSDTSSITSESDISKPSSIPAQESEVQTDITDSKPAEIIENTSSSTETEVIISSEKIVPKGEKINVVLIGDLSEQDKITTFIPADYGCEVYAAQSGLCIYNAVIGDCGFCVCLQLDSGGYAYYFSLEPYALVDKRNTVKIMVGEMVEEGQLIGYTHENGFYVNENKTGSGVGYRYSNIKPPALPNYLDRMSNSYMHPSELKSYQKRGFVLPEHYQAIVDDYNTFIQTHNPSEWYGSENEKKWIDIAEESFNKRMEKKLKQSALKEELNQLEEELNQLYKNGESKKTAIAEVENKIDALKEQLNQLSEQLNSDN